MEQTNSRKGSWKFLSIFFLFILCNVLVSLPMASGGSAIIQVSVKGTYLRAELDQTTQSSSSVDLPGIFDLESKGISEGDIIIIDVTGSVDRYGQTDYKTIEDIGGVFSCTNQLLSIDDAHRIPGAIDAGEDYYTQQTWFNGQTTDILEDFKINPPTGFKIQVPENAKYLFISFIDSYYPDNTSPSQMKITLNKQTFPLEYLLIALGIVVVIATFLIIFMLKRKKPHP